jgi:hypothetical protein
MSGEMCDVLCKVLSLIYTYFLTNFVISLLLIFSHLTMWISIILFSESLTYISTSILCSLTYLVIFEHFAIMFFIIFWNFSALVSSNTFSFCLSDPLDISIAHYRPLDFVWQITKATLLPWYLPFFSLLLIFVKFYWVLNACIDALFVYL